MKTDIIGIVGGMGPAATVKFIDLIVKATPADKDQDHIRLLLDMNPAIPDRTRAILGQGPSPVPELVKSSELLRRAGATFLAYPCNTVHHFLPQVQEQVPIPMINMIEETAKHLERQGIERVAVLATDGTLQTGLYQQAIGDRQVTCLLPPPKVQSAVMKTIYDIKSCGDLGSAEQIFAPVLSWAQQSGAQAMIAGCTELSLILCHDTHAGLMVIDAMRVLAEAVVGLVLGP